MTTNDEMSGMYARARSGDRPAARDLLDAFASRLGLGAVAVVVEGIAGEPIEAFARTADLKGDEFRQVALRLRTVDPSFS